MKQKNLILIRHGESYDKPPYELSFNGERSIKVLSNRLLFHIKGDNHVFITSIAPRALKSAQILQEQWANAGFSIDYDPRYEIWSGPDALEEQLSDKLVKVWDIDWLISFIKSIDSGIIIVVTHLAFTQKIPIILGFKERNIIKGYARIFDLISQSELSF